MKLRVGDVVMSPSVRRLLVHAIECGGAWLRDDPVRMRASTVSAAERRGLIRVEQFEGSIAAATITARGRAAMLWFEREPEGGAR